MRQLDDEHFTRALALDDPQLVVNQETFPSLHSSPSDFSDADNLSEDQDTGLDAGVLAHDGVPLQ